MNDQDRTLGNYLETGRDPDRAFHVVALHDGPSAEMRVNRALAWLHDAFRADLRMVFNSWSLRKLDLTVEARAASIRAGGSADLIILATSDSEPLPDQIRGWLDDTLSQQRDHRSLIVALENDHSPSGNTTGRLGEHVERVATSSGASHLSCEDLQQSVSRQSVLRFINHRFHDSIGRRDRLPENEAPDLGGGLRQKMESMNQSQAAMTPRQLEEVRELAYHLWIQAGRPTLQEVDFWLQAEEKMKAEAVARSLNESASSPTNPSS